MEKDWASGKSTKSGGIVSLVVALAAGLAAAWPYLRESLSARGTDVPSAQAQPPARPRTQVQPVAAAQKVAPRAGVPSYVARGAGDGYTAGMPPPELVRQRLQGDNAMETAARQAAAFYILGEALGALMGNRQFFEAQKTPAERQLQKGYLQAGRAASEQAAQTLSGPEKLAWNRRYQQLEVSAAFQRYVIEQTTSPKWRSDHIANWSSLAAMGTEVPSARAPSGSP